MFEEIEKNGIEIFNKKQNSRIFIPNIISFGPLELLFKATEWIVNQSKKDYDHTFSIIERNRKRVGASRENLNKIEDLSIRTGSRIQGYVNQVCLMDDILSYEYERMSELINKSFIGVYKIDFKNDLKNLKERLNNIRNFRNKVVAHTAYTYPKINKKTKEIEDTPTTIVNSILNLFPKDTTTSLGNNFFMGFVNYQQEFGVVDINNWETEVKPIFEDFKKLFIEKLVEISKKCPIENTDFKIIKK